MFTAMSTASDHNWWEDLAQSVGLNPVESSPSPIPTPDLHQPHLPYDTGRSSLHPDPTHPNWTEHPAEIHGLNHLNAFSHPVQEFHSDSLSSDSLSSDSLAANSLASHGSTHYPAEPSTLHDPYGTSWVFDGSTHYPAHEPYGTTQALTEQHYHYDAPHLQLGLSPFAQTYDASGSISPVSQQHDLYGSQPLGDGTHHSLTSLNSTYRFHSEPQVFKSDQTQPYVYISDTGNIFRHNRDDSETLVGHVDNQKFYGAYNHFIGNLSHDWKIYDSHNEYVGYVDSHCNVHRPDGTVVYHANTALGGAAWMLYIGMGGRS